MRKSPCGPARKDGGAKFSMPASAGLRQRIASIGPWHPYAPWCPILCTTGLRHRMAATSAFSSDRGNAWMRQLMAPVGPEANWERGPGSVMKKQFLRLRHSRSTRGVSASLLTCPIAILLWNGLWPLLPPHSLGLWPTMYAESLSCDAWKACPGQATTMTGARAGQRR